MKVQSRIFFAIVVLYAVTALAGCRAKPAGKGETNTMNWIKHHVTVGGKKIVNPIAATATNIDAGKQVFGYYCVECHGRDGQNTGVPFAANLAPPVPSLASRQVQSYTDGQLKWIIDNGISPSGMPASKGTLSDDEIWQLVLFIRHLPPAGSLGEPRAYTGDEYESTTTESK
jgi:mono/diheme cytochrome c family protein